MDREEVVLALVAAGCVAAVEEADELERAALAQPDGWLEAAVARRASGEPLAWVCGSIEVDGRRLAIEPGTYVPRRWQTPAVARRAARSLAPGGTAVDLCCGAGTLAALVSRAVPGATVLATDVDPTAVACARRNGVDAHVGDLFEPLPPALRGSVHVVCAVAPYVPSTAVALLPADARDHEPIVALDGGTDGLDVVRRIVAEAPAWLRPGGWVVLELGVDQVGAVTELLATAGFDAPDVVLDPEGTPCGIAARRPS